MQSLQNSMIDAAVVELVSMLIILLAIELVENCLLAIFVIDDNCD